MNYTQKGLIPFYEVRVVVIFMFTAYSIIKKNDVAFYYYFCTYFFDIRAPFFAHFSSYIIRFDILFTSDVPVEDPDKDKQQVERPEGSFWSKCNLM